MNLPFTTPYLHHFDGHGLPLREDQKCPGHFVIHAHEDGGTVVICDECGDGYRTTLVVINTDECRFPEGPRREGTPTEFEYEELEAWAKSGSRLVRSKRGRGPKPAK